MISKTPILNQSKGPVDEKYRLVLIKNLVFNLKARFIFTITTPELDI